MERKILAFLKTFFLCCQVGIGLITVYTLYIPLKIADVYWKHPEFLPKILPTLTFVLFTLLLLFFIARFLWKIAKSVH
ncbi:MAG: hypothetical protein PHD51_01390 [Patescibacteria group bacterium]|nr:hypothetical protein [Patescibacteria group bacterium]MDD5490485.1 hypothetical protein [Patescibacteria group bacterium]